MKFNCLLVVLLGFLTSCASTQSMTANGNPGLGGPSAITQPTGSEHCVSIVWHSPRNRSVATYSEDGMLYIKDQVSEVGGDPVEIGPKPVAAEPLLAMPRDCDGRLAFTETGDFVLNACPEQTLQPNLKLRGLPGVALHGLTLRLVL